MRKETAAERAAWTAHIEGREVEKKNKYGAERSGKYASKKEALIAMRLHALARHNIISELREQVRFVLVEGQGKIRPICYIADFVYVDEEQKRHIVDVKGYSKNQAYRLKRKMMKLLHGLDIEEV